VERYIEKCIHSILAQSHSNIELIVVDDGSSDDTGRIVDDLLNEDGRVSCYHINNSGVSAARNYGIEKSKGDYLVFVDGDDFISTDFVSYMLELVEVTNSDFCFSTSCYTKKGERQSVFDGVSKVTPEYATALLFSPEVVVGCWNKIYKRDLIMSNNIRFSTSLFYGEGLRFITDVSQRSNSVGIGGRKVYHYRKNNESSATTKFDMEKVYNGERALLEINDLMVLDSALVRTMFNYHICLYRLAALIQVRANGLGSLYREDYRRWLSYIRNNFYKFLLVRDLSYYRKLLLFAGCVSPYLVMKLDVIRRRRIISSSVR